MTDPSQLPSDYDKLEPWFNIIRNANRTTLRGSVQWMVIIAYIDETGRPMIHGKPDILRYSENTHIDEIVVK